MEKLVRAEIEARKYVLGQQRKSPSNEQQFNWNPNKLTLEAEGKHLFELGYHDLIRKKEKKEGANS